MKMKIDKKQFEEIGIKHNFAVKHMLENTDKHPTKENIVKYVYSGLKYILPEEYQIFTQYGSPIDFNYSDMIIYNRNPDFNTYLYNLGISDNLKKLLVQMSELTLKELPLNELEVGLYEIEIYGYNILNEADLVVLLSATSVARYSAKFWYPESLGGEGGMKYLSNNTLQSRGFNWGALITVDAVGVVAGAAGALIGTGGAAALPLCGGVPCASWVFVSLWTHCECFRCRF